MDFTKGQHAEDILNAGLAAVYAKDKTFLDMAQEIADKFSTDRSRKTGCVFVGPDNDIRTSGFNTFPAGVKNLEERHQRPAKYLWTEHAERRAVFAAAKNGTRLEGCKVYVNWFPCVGCARAIIDSGATFLIGYEPNFDDPTYGEEFKVAFEMIKEAGLGYRLYQGAAMEQK